MQAKLPIAWIKKQDISDDEQSVCSDDYKPYLQAKKDDWTRVKTPIQMQRDNVQVYDLNLDLKNDKQIARIRENLNDVRSELLFDPEKYSVNNLSLTVERQRLTENALMNYGQQATELRQKFARLAIEAAKESERTNPPQNEGEELASDKLMRKYFGSKKPMKPSVGIEGFEHSVLFSRRKYRKGSELSMNDRKQIIADLRSNKMSTQEVSDKFKTKLGVIQWINRDAKKGGPLFKRKEARQ
jgi:hypothetical protein